MHDVKNEKKPLITYQTVTTGYDWGPAINKVVLNMGTSIDEASIHPQDFQVKGRKILDAYVSNDQGQSSGPSAYVTLELEVGPSLTEASPFRYNNQTGRNAWVPIDCEIRLSPNSPLWDKALAFSNMGNISPLCDAFVHNQPYSEGDVRLRYAFFRPKMKAPAKTPLIIWLHGAGEGGEDTTIAVLGNRVTNLIKPEIQTFFGANGAYVLVPQSPTMWMDVNGQGLYNTSVEEAGDDSFYSKTLMGLIKAFVASHPEIDSERIYIGGCSNGGYMTVKLITEAPGYFAAAFPVAAAYDASWLTDAKIDALKTCPMWITHTENDPVVPCGPFSSALYQRLVSAGASDIYYSLFPKVVDTSGLYMDEKGQPYEYHGHWSWVYALNNACYEPIKGQKLSLFHWLSLKKRK